MPGAFDEHVEAYELDVVPERELQTWEIMNACYLEMLERHPEASAKDKEDYFHVLVALSVGLRAIQSITANEIVKTYAKNYIGDKKGLIAGMWSALLR